jgi:DNA-binding NarL/FixJ family response regulator
MAHIICTEDTFLAELCKDLFGKNDSVLHLSGKKELNKHQTGSHDILMIDLDCLTEQEFPKVVSPTMALVTVPVIDQAMRLLHLGVHAYGNRHMREENLVQAVTAIKSGQVWLPPEIVSRMIMSLPGKKGSTKEPSFLKDLSKREKEVAQWVANGLSNNEVADKMFISIRTVKAHLTSIFSKTGCRDRLELASRMK